MAPRVGHKKWNRRNKDFSQGYFQPGVFWRLPLVRGNRSVLGNPPFKAQLGLEGPLEFSNGPKGPGATPGFRPGWPKK